MITMPIWYWLGVVVFFAACLIIQGLMISHDWQAREKARVFAEGVKSIAERWRFIGRLDADGSSYASGIREAVAEELFDLIEHGHDVWACDLDALKKRIEWNRAHTSAIVKQRP